MMKLCLWGSSSIYFKEHITALKDEFDLISIAIITDSKDSFPYDIRLINRHNPFISRRLNLLKIMYLFLKYDKICDCHIIHGLKHEYALAIALLPLKKPIIYISYGSDVRKPVGYRMPERYLKWINRKALEKMDTIISYARSFYKKYIVDQYGIDERKILQLWVFPIDPVFRKIDDIEKIKKKWGINRKYAIFSPRATMELYNHHLIIDALSMVNLKDDIQFIITGFGEQKYRERLIKLAEGKGVSIINLRKVLAPEEMAEVYNISVITPNIPVVEDLGRSPFEAILCDSIVLLNKSSKPQREIFRDGKYCKFVELDARSIADTIESILNKPEEYKDEEEYNRIKDIVNWDKNKRILINYIKSIRRS